MSGGTGATSVAARTRWFVVALLPLLGLRVLETPALGVLVAGSLLLTMTCGALAAWLGHQPLRLAWLDEAHWATALLVPVWFGSGVSPGWLATALLVAWASRLPFGGMGEQLFHPAMVGSAALLVLGQVPAPAADALVGSPLLDVAAVAFAGALLAWKLRRDLRAPVALLLAFGGVSALLHGSALADFPGHGGWMQVSLAAFLVANDPVTAPSRAAARVVFGASTGMAAALLPGGADALPFALLALQAAAPWLDRSAGHRAPAAGAHAQRPAP